MVYRDGEFNAQFVHYDDSVNYVLSMMELNSKRNKMLNSKRNETYEIYAEFERYNKTVERTLYFNSTLYQ